MAYAPFATKWRAATVLLLVVTLLIARASLSNPHTPAAAQGTVPTATATPDPTVVPTARSDVHDAQDQLGGLFSQIEGDPPASSDVETLASRLVGIDFGQLANAIESPVGPKDPVTGIPQTPHKLVLNLFADVVLTGIVEHVEPTASGHALWGGLEGVELGTMTLVVNGSVVVGTVRTPDAVYTIRTAGAGAYVVRQIDESSLPPLGEPLRGSIPEPDSPPPVRPQVRGPDAPDGTSTPTSTPTPVPTVATSPSKPAPDEAMANGLFSEVEGDPPPSPGVDTLASRLVEIDFGQLSQVTKSPVGPKDPVTGKPTEPQALVLNLFDDVVLTGIVEHVEPTSSGHSLWGRLDGVGLGTFTLVVNGRMVIGTVRTPDAVYTIRTAGDGTYVIRQIDESSLPPLGEPLEGPVTPRDSHTQADDVPPDDGSEIDVMVVYTPLAKHREGGRAAIEALIDLFVAETNQAYANSGVIHRINLVLREEVDYTEDGGSSLDLRRLSNGSDGHMDHVHERRDMYGADLVHILVGRSDVGGRAFFIALESSADGEALGFGLTASFSGLVFAHELGHNMGLLHDRYQIGVPRTGSHYGYVNQRMFEPGAPESARWRTIMAYPDQCSEVAEYYCEQIGSFSNPENNYNGDPMGVPADHPSTGVDGPANAVGTLNDRREITANFRQSSASPSPRVHLTLSPYWLSENGGVSKVTATLHRPSSADTTVTILASPSDAVTLSGSRTLTIPAGRTVSVASVTITGVDNGDQTGDVSVTVSATAANTSSLGVVDPEPVALVIADDETTPVVTLSLSPSEIAEHEGWTFVTAMLDSRSSADTIVSVSAEPAELIEQRWDNTLTIPAGQTESIWFGVSLLAVDNDELAEATQTVTVSGTSENPHGVAGPENVTLTIIDDEAPFFAADSIAYTFTAGIAVSRFLPEAEFGNGKLTYSLSPAPSNDVTFTPEPPARIGVSATSVAAGETSYTLTATDADGDTDTMTISITVRKGVCPNSAAVSGYSDPGIVHDCEALLASRDTLSVDQSLNWDEDLPIDEWKGVELADGRVVELRMSSEGIVGTIPSELGSLSNLLSLSLWGNRLTGGIPKELGNLANLRSLSLSGNRLTGEIPPELGRLANLTELSLFGNQLTGEIPPELGRLANLTELWLSRNQLTGEIPPELGGLSNLWLLFLYGNQLTGGIPPELGSLSNLLSLSLWANQLTGGIPKELENLADLRGLDLYGNQLTGGIPKELGNLANLRALDLYGNQLTGEIPKELGNLANLRALRLQGNQLTGEIPKELGNLSNLTLLFLYGNQLTGEIPKELGNLSNLQELYLGGNLLTGCVPDGLRDVPNNDIVSLGLPFCSEQACVSGGAVVDATNEGLVSDCGMLLAARDTLAGTAALNWSADTPIADWTGVALGETSGRVTEILLGSIGLDGKIPKQLGSLANLQSLDLSDNKLTGTIPTELGSLANLQELYLGGNLLTGCVPDGLRDVPNNDIVSLGLPFCSEHPCVSGGAVVDATNEGLVSDCGMLLAARDTLAGTAALNWSADTPIADWTGVALGEASGRVTEILLGGMGLNGRIPPELGGLSNLTRLSLFSNQLTGEIPPELGRLANLTGLYLYVNQLTGEIPPELGGLSNLTGLWLQGNQLTGVIPKELGNLSNLTLLFLYGNQLTGEIPPELGRLANLEWLYLGGNLLTGCVPDGLRDVPNNDIVRLGLPFCDEHPCVSGGAVVDATNDGLRSDCETLLAARDALVGTATLNWSADTPIAEWNGVVLGGTHGRVTELLLGGLSLNGGIPMELGSLADLTRLFLGQNQLTGEIPKELGNLANLQKLNLFSNQLTGEIPKELGNLANLQVLNLWVNQLTGEMPKELGNLANLQILWLGWNQLSGEIPKELKNLANLRGLQLWKNQLSGEVPKELASLANLQELFLSDNQLTGTIPTELGNLANLQLLDLSNNRLTGEIPTELGNLSNMKWLWLSNNQLTGEIPTELGRLTRLTRLALNDNDLVGSIPASLGSLSNLEGLSLSDNRLTGCVPPRLRDVPDNDLDQLGLPFCPLSPPEAPTISSVTSEMDSITISWTPPLSDGGSDITAYDLRHIETDDDEAVGSNWTVAEDVWTSGSGALEYTLTGLTVGTEYDIQVRAVNAVGDGTWSATVTATLTTVSTCAAGVAVPDPTSNPGLVSVCESLLTLLDTLVEGTVLNWSADIPISEWDGIEEDSLEGTPPQVVRLYLGGLGLDGAVPSELSGLTELKELYLQDNDLSGPVPVELGDLSSLTHLHLQNNDLTGGIPAELGDLAVLRELRLDSNDLTGQLPEELGSLTRVTRLWVADNDLSGSIPAELGDMANLDWLNLGRNNFSGQIPAELGSLSRMRRLYIYENDLSGPIPGALGSLSRLTHIVAQANDLSGEIPEELGSLANLVWMGLHDNDLTGEIPAELGGLAKLQRLYLTNNELYGEVPEELGDLSALTNLWLNHNYLSGQIPHSLDNLDKLSRLRLAGNRFTGCLPTGLAAVRNSDTDQLGLETCADPAVGTEYGVQEKTASGAVAPKQAATGDCATGGAVPDAANNPGLVSDCEALLSAREALVGNTGNAELNWSADTPIREWDGIEEDSLEGAPPQVVRLYLNGLGLGGAIPSGLSGLTALKELYLHDNDLAGPIPPDLGNLSSLTHLNLQNNDLTGGIPAELGDLAVLRELRLDSNDLTGQLAPELGKLTRATRLWVADNDLSGPIPAEFGDMANLDWLNLGWNNFSGQIPAELGDLARMRRLYVYENDLSGPIPGTLGSLSRLTHIVAQANDLSGEIPTELGNLSSFVWMGLHDNDLTGEIPAELGGLAKLQRLYLTNNELYGGVPEELGDLSALTNLWLNHNYLSGQIPHSLDNLDKLSRLRLAGNRFTGCLPTGLAAVRNSDTDQLGLETCSAS